MILLPPDTLPIARTFKKNEVRSYHVKLTDEREDYTEKIEYRLVFKCKDSGKDSGVAVLDFKCKDYRETMLGHASGAGTAGGGSLTLGSYGLPIGLESSLKNYHFWYPLLEWELPLQVKDGAFKTAEELGDGLVLNAAGTVKDVDYQLNGSIDRQGQPVVNATLKWSISSDGWLAHGEGKLTGGAGDVSFTIES